MNIERTCKITLSAEEVKRALTDYIVEKHRYKSGHDAVKSYEEVLALPAQLDAGVTVTWGVAPEPEEPERDEPVSSGITCSEAACARDKIGDEHNPEPLAHLRG